MHSKTVVLVSSMLVFSIVWIIVVVPLLMRSEAYKTLVPPFQFLILQAGFITLCMLLFGFPVSYLVHGELVLSEVLRIGFGTWMGVSVLFDLWLPPYYVNYDGSVVLQAPEVLSGAAIDASVVWMFQQLGVSGRPLFLHTYITFPLLILVLIALTLTPKQLIEFLKG